MSNKIYKTIPVMAAVNEVAWYSQERDQLTALSVKARWNLKKNMKELEKLSTMFDELRNSLDQELRDKYATDEKSVDTEIVGADGTKQPGRRVKDEYLDEYQKEVEEMNQKINELLANTEEVELYVIDMDAEVERMSDDADISDTAMDMLSLFMDESGE